MSELREDPMTGAHVVIAPARRGLGATRPGGPPTPAGRCPFCPGHEADTEPALLTSGEPWALRVVANKFPLFAPGTASPGAHEVLVEHRAHDTDLARYDAAHAARVLRALRDRLAALEAAPDTRAATFFRNRGRRAGSSQPHPHAQLVAMPIVPHQIALRAARAAAFTEATGENLLAAEVTRERRDRLRVVDDAEGWLTFAPFAPERAFHVRLASTEPAPRFAALTDARLDALAPRLVAAVAAALSASGADDYNVLLRPAPVGSPHAQAFFLIDVLPRTGGDAGFELGTGTPVCIVPPEEAAAAVRARLAVPPPSAGPASASR